MRQLRAAYSTAAAALVAAVLTACGGGNGGDAGGGGTPATTNSPSILTTATATTGTPVACAALAGMVIPASAIGLPTSGGTVTSAAVVAPSGTGARALPEYCLVNGSISPVDKSAPNILFRLALPTTWNSKVVMFGGGGFDGSIPSVVGNVPLGPTDQLFPLGRGYAVFASDSGHQAGPLGSQDASNWGLNDEAVRNFSGDALKKTRDASVFLAKARYAVDKVQKAYFIGGSTGGRESIESITRWPEDWDGAIAWYPAWNQTAAVLGGHRMNRALAQPGAYPNVAKRQLLLNAVMAVCDGLDGVVDGLIANQARCNATFDPATANYNGLPLRCPGGLDTGDTCLSDAQITALKVINTDTHFNYLLASGETQYPGYNVWGADLGITTNPSPLEPTVTFLALGTSQPVLPMPTSAPYISVMADQWAKYLVTRDPGYDSLSLDPENPGPWEARISQLSTQLDQKVNLDAFAAKGGKLIMAHGTVDVLVSTRATQQYYQRLQARMSPSEVDKFVRYYEIAGLGHAASSIFNPAWDSLTALENWVEKGTAPANQIMTDTAGVAGRTRPMCDYPLFPQYKGTGDVNSAASFSCVNYDNPPPTQRQTQFGTVIGSDATTTTGTYSWKGVPFAKAPVGALRWKAPVDPDPWTTPKMTQQFGNACAQSGRLYGPGLNNRYDSTIGTSVGQTVGSEDCLYLNIWRPAGGATNLPVVVWVHGGSNISGYTADPMYDGANLAHTGNVVVVSVNYRLGMFGFFNLPQLKTGANALDDSGNYAMLDIIKALNFVNKNIAAFGGEPGNVTLMGQSAGAVNVYAVMTSPLVVNANIVHKLLPISGGISLANEVPAGSIATLAPASAYQGQAAALAAFLAVNDGLTSAANANAFVAAQSADNVALYMRSKSADTILTTVLKNLAPLGASGSGPIPEGAVIPLDPIANIKAGKALKVPMLIGNARDEGKLFPTLFSSVQAGLPSGRLLTDPQVFNIAYTNNPNAPSISTIDQWIPAQYLPVNTPVTGFTDRAQQLNQIFFLNSRDSVISALKTQQNNIWYYRFDWDKLPAPYNDIYGAAHAFDLPFFFGNFGPSLYANISYSTANQPGRLALSDAMMRTIGKFAATGDPNNATLGVTWPVWPSTLLFNATNTAKQISVQ